MQKTINTKSVVQDLKMSVSPFLFLWDEWINGGHCSLTPEEIHITNIYLKNNFDAGLSESALNYHVELLERLVLKLKLDYSGFKEWVVFKFLCCLIRTAKVHDSGHFLTTPIEVLKIPEEIRINLKTLNIINIKQLFDERSDDDLLEDPVYTNIVAFHQLNQRYRIDAPINEMIRE